MTNAAAKIMALMRKVLLFLRWVIIRLPEGSVEWLCLGMGATALAGRMACSFRVRQAKRVPRWQIILAPR